MTVTVIIPNFNEEKTIIEILKKVNNQKSKHLDIDMEIIVVDDCSTDRSKELLKENHKFDGLILIVSTSELTVKDVPTVTNLNKPILRGFTKNLGPIRELAIERASIEHLIQNTETYDIDKVASLELKRRFVNINLQINWNLKVILDLQIHIYNTIKN